MAAPKQKQPEPSTHVAIPNAVWNELAGFLEQQPWVRVDAIIKALAATKTGVHVK